ncbi:putative transcriptional regulator, TetR family protein [Nocardia camponoti]|uniref:Transcriptional regulator, TetR family protein n=2 Tax=Nocardia camponoti TaxID=1616106 RepID=A0A917Q8I9_9NOCA|nr:putative transcriptional regulator, TetR family protein [Nocardia camponoti]
MSGRKERWKPHNESRRERLMLAAIELLEETPAGVEVPVVQIAERAGLAKSVMYRQFAGREELDRLARRDIAERFTNEIEDALDISVGSINEILYRTVEAVVAWVQGHPRLHEFLKTGPSEENSDTDALSSLITSISSSVTSLVTGLAGVVGVADDDAADTMTFAIVSMTEATVTRWATDPSPALPRERLISEVASYAWHVVDGVARQHDLVLDPDLPLTTIISQLAARA